MRNGNFSELLTRQSFFKSRAITDPLNNNAPFAGNIIPQSRISPNGQVCSTYTHSRYRLSAGASNWIGAKSTHSDLRKDTFRSTI
jgi:hypothetical protein